MYFPDTTKEREVYMMDKLKVIRAFEKIAKKEGISVDEVRCEIQKAFVNRIDMDIFFADIV